MMEFAVASPATWIAARPAAVPPKAVNDHQTHKALRKAARASSPSHAAVGSQLQGLDAAAPPVGAATVFSPKAAALAISATAAVAVAASARRRSQNIAAQRERVRGAFRGAKLTVMRAEADEAGAVDEAEQIFKTAYEAEVERATLLKSQVETALTEKLKAVGGEVSARITVQAPDVPPSPADGGTGTWREAYEAAKKRTKSLEDQLNKARSMGQAAPQPPPQATPVQTPASTPTTEPPKQDAGAAAGGTTPPVAGAGGSDPAGFSKLENLAQNVIEDESALQMIAVPILGRTPGELVQRLPTAARVREVIGSDQYVISETVEFERVYVLKGSLASSVAPANAVETLRKRFVDAGLMDVEIFLQKSKEEGRPLIFVMLKEDLPSPEFAWWQWALCLVLLVFTLLTACDTTFSVATANIPKLDPQNMDEVVKLASKTLPTGAAIFGTVAAQEVARRIVAASYDVKLTPPFFIPVWPFPSVGSFGAISRRLSMSPNDEAALAMSTAAGVAGYLVAGAILAAGLSAGADPDGIVNLNFQLLPLALKLVLKPFLGAAVVTDQPDPFAPPINIAFAANPVTIGGIIGLIVVSLNLLPIGRLDGGAIAKAAFGGRTGGLLGFFGLALTLLGALAPGDAGILYITFGFFCIVFQNGNEIPARDGVTEPDGLLKSAGILLLFLGTLLSVPGALFPNL